MGNLVTAAPSQVLDIEQCLADLPVHAFDKALRTTRFLKVPPSDPLLPPTTLAVATPAILANRTSAGVLGDMHQTVWCLSVLLSPATSTHARTRTQFHILSYNLWRPAYPLYGYALI